MAMTIEWNLILRILIAGLLGGLMGFEREMRAKEAGVRTHFIVALGSALFMIISQYAFEGRFDASRVAAQVVSGIGFIGAGVIIFQKNAVRGVTTAAGLWVAAAVGLACGAGMYSVAIAAVLLSIACLEMMHFITRRWGEKVLRLSVSPVNGEQLATLLEKFRQEGLEIDSFTLTDSVAVIVLHVRNSALHAVSEKLLLLTQGYKVDLS